MVSSPKRPRLVAIVGPTASGKSGLGMRLAKDFNGEIICADSRTVYKGMDIGTAKPTEADQKEVPHWGLDLVEPGEAFSAAKFKDYAQAAIDNIQNRGKLPILVGGSGLYVDAILFDFGFSPNPKPSSRERLEALNLEALHDFITEMSLPMPFNFKNKRHLVRVIERGGKQGLKRINPLEGSLIIGLLPSDEILKEQIRVRAEQMFKFGIVRETQNLLDRYGTEVVTGSAGIAYLVVESLIRGEIAAQEATKLIATNEWQYARRQKTWFKRNVHIKWFTDTEEAYKSAQKELMNT